jgi:hypothetical protein
MRSSIHEQVPVSEQHEQCMQLGAYLGTVSAHGARLQVRFARGLLDAMAAEAFTDQGLIALSEQCSNLRVGTWPFSVNCVSGCAKASSLSSFGLQFDVCMFVSRTGAGSSELQQCHRQSAVRAGSQLPPPAGKCSWQQTVAHHDASPVL